jgi:hypothetical protein
MPRPIESGLFGGGSNPSVKPQEQQLAQLQVGNNPAAESSNSIILEEELDQNYEPTLEGLSKDILAPFNRSNFIFNHTEIEE